MFKRQCVQRFLYNEVILKLLIQHSLCLCILNAPSDEHEESKMKSPRFDVSIAIAKRQSTLSPPTTQKRSPYTPSNCPNIGYSDNSNFPEITYPQITEFGLQMTQVQAYAYAGLPQPVTSQSPSPPQTISRLQLSSPPRNKPEY